MNQDRASESLAAQEQLRIALAAATAEVASMPEGEERFQHLRGLATLLVGAPEDVRALAVHQCPDLERVEPFPDTLLDPSEQQTASRLSSSDIRVFDEALIAHSLSSWQEVARVIGGAMVTVDNQFPGMSHAFYAQRIGALVQRGELLARGDVEFMRLSEVRLPARGDGEA